ncbi:hypothetical protein [Streptosporangium sandarakinum]
MTDDCGCCDVPVSAPLTDLQIAQHLPGLRPRPGDLRPHTRGELRELLLL